MLPIMVLMILSTTGCAVFCLRSMRFVEEGQQPLLVFTKHEIEPQFSSALYGTDKNQFRIRICQRQPAPPDSVDASALEYVRLGDLSVSFEDKGDPIRLVPPVPGDSDWRGILEDGYLHGPVYEWGWVHIPKGVAWIEITYTAVLVRGDGYGESDPLLLRRRLHREKEWIAPWAL